MYYLHIFYFYSNNRHVS